VALENAQSKSHKQSTQLKHLELNWHNNQALILAKEIEAGIPCPVCGSQEHPQPASIKQLGNGKEVSKSDIDAARKCLEEYLLNQSTLQNSLTKLTAELEGLSIRYQEQATELGTNQNSTAEELRQEWVTLNKQKKSLEDDKIQLSNFDNQIQTLSNNRKTAESALETSRQEANLTQQNLLLIQQERKQTEIDLPEK